MRNTLWPKAYKTTCPSKNRPIKLNRSLFYRQNTSLFRTLRQKGQLLLIRNKTSNLLSKDLCKLNLKREKFRSYNWMMSMTIFLWMPTHLYWLRNLHRLNKRRRKLRNKFKRQLKRLRSKYNALHGNIQKN